MDSWHGNPSPSVPMESVCRHFPPPWLLYFVVYFLSLSRTNTPRYSCHGRPSPSDLMESCRLPTCISTQSATLYFAVYLISLSRTALRWVWLFMAFVHRTQFGCIGQHFKLLLFSGKLRNIALIHYLFAISTNFIQTWRKRGQLFGHKFISNRWPIWNFKCARSRCKTCHFFP